MKLTTSAQMRELDRIAIEERHIPSVELMERAAEGVAAAVLTLLPDQAAHCRIAALCGAGNNGGDGIAAARLLFFRGMQVRCFLVGRYERLTPDSLEMTRRLSDCGVELESFDPENAGAAAVYPSMRRGDRRRVRRGTQPGGGGGQRICRRH